MFSDGTPRAADKIEAFCLNPAETVIYAGTVGGELASFSSADLTLLATTQAHAGIIAAIAFHKEAGVLGCLSSDNTVSLWRAQDETLRFLCRIPLWRLQPTNDPRTIGDFQSESQALAFHDTWRRIATRTANGALLEVDFDDFGKFRYRTCIRLFESSDLTCVQYVPGTSLLLAGSIGGQLGLVAEGEVVGHVVTGGSNIHWIEPLGNSDFLLASDSRQVMRVSLYDLQQPLIGPKFCRDDLEHVALSRDGRSAYVGSFDRRIYRVNAKTCHATEVVFEAPFKCRWVRPLPGEGERIAVQTRDGGLHIVDALEKQALCSIRHTPPAYWTTDRIDDTQLYLAGELDALHVVNTATKTLSAVSLPAADCSRNAYTKRLAAIRNGGECLLGRTDGQVFRCGPVKVSRTANVGGPVRDICPGPDDTAFVALEDGRVLRITNEDLSIIHEFASPLDEPIWSLTYNGDDDLAIAERSGHLRILSARDLRQKREAGKLVRPKRMKWQTPTLLYFGWSDQLRSFDATDGTETTIIDSIGNTIEDFIVQPEFDYVVFISYMRNIYLCRISTGDILSTVPDGLDYSKGLAWVERDPSLMTAKTVPAFMTYGRHGALNFYNIVSEKIMPAGSFALPVSLRPPERGELRAHDLAAT